MLDDAEIVADEEVGQIEGLSQIHEQVDDLRLDRDVERGDGLVAHQELRVHCERARDADAAPLPAGELVRIAALKVGIEADPRSMSATNSARPDRCTRPCTSGASPTIVSTRMRGLSEA